MAKPTTPKLILASASPRRAGLLKAAGITPHAVRPVKISERRKQGETPKAMAERLALAKAQAGAKQHKGAFVLAADTVVAAGRRVLGKPAGRGEAEAFLRLLSGRRHTVFTAIAVIAPDGKVSRRTAATRVAFKRLTDQEIAWALGGSEWKDKAGGYALQGRAGLFVKALNGSHSNVIGLPLLETAALLAGAGYPLYRTGK